LNEINTGIWDGDYSATPLGHIVARSLCKFKAILLQGIALAMLLQVVSCVVTAHSENLFYNRASVPEAAKLGLRKHLVLHLRVCQTGKRTGRQTRISSGR